MSFNLSAIAVRERAATLFFLLLLAAAGAYAFFMLGRAEDPSFTIKTLTVTTVWPGATAREMQDQVAEPLEKRIQELTWYGPGGDDHTAGLCVHDRDAEGQHTAIERAGGILSGPQEAGR
ncbi:hypothetical protein ACVWXM_001564 [Bradyrhizobium sp. GM7.3]